MKTIEHCREQDRRDPLRVLRERFSLPPGIVYLDGNSLGALPKATAARVATAVTREWGEGLVRSWNSAGWFDLPRKVGDQIAALIGAASGEVVATDSTSVNLYKVLGVALSIVAADAPQRKTVASEHGNFPTDLYVAQALCHERGYTLQLGSSGDGDTVLVDATTAVLVLSHVNYRTGAMHDMQAVTAAAHDAGALVVWDLAHSAGAVPVDLLGAGADFAVGCGYKYLNGGPGAPAFVWAHPRHVDRHRQPLAGWWGHAQPFEFAAGYRPAAGIARYLCGTQPILSLTALECGLEVFEAANAFGGMAALRAKSLALCDLFIGLVEERCAGHGLALVTPRAHARRGSQVCLARTDPRGPKHREGNADSGAHAIVQALIARGVIGDFRAGDGKRQPDMLRFGFAPLYVGFEDVWHAVEQLRDVLESGEWQQPEFHRKHRVT